MTDRNMHGVNGPYKYVFRPGLTA